MALLGVRQKKRPVIVALGLFGAALIYGDGAITPAISVLSALEGVKILTPALEPYILPATVIILIALFAIQPQGTSRIGRAFGPIMTAWFVTIGLLGVWGVARNPSVLWALDPRLGLSYLLSSGATGFLALGGVFLCVTGAEALYADMGHFGRRPIRLAWSLVVFPSLVLNYAGQTALVLQGAPVSENIFYRLCPEPLVAPLVVLATVATVIASQSIITGAFSMTRQAIRLGWAPPLQVTQTSPQGYGQIYVGAVNWALMIVTVGLAVAFRKSDNLAAAYGIAVSMTMLMTSALLFVAMREALGWSLAAAGVVAGGFFVVDAAFFAANLTKVAEGGYVPLVLAAVVYGLMYTWHAGTALVAARIRERVMPVGAFMDKLEQQHIPRVPGAAVFLTGTQRDVPPTMLWHVKYNRALHGRLLVLTVEILSTPWLKNATRLSVEEIAPNFWRATARYGFMERPDIQALVREAGAQGCDIDQDDVTYYVGRETVIPQDDDKGLPYPMEVIFAWMQRNSSQVSDFCDLPLDKVVEIGRQVEL